MQLRIGIVLIHTCSRITDFWVTSASIFSTTELEEIIIVISTEVLIKGFNNGALIFDMVLYLIVVPNKKFFANIHRNGKWLTVQLCTYKVQKIPPNKQDYVIFRQFHSIAALDVNEEALPHSKTTVSTPWIFSGKLANVPFSSLRRPSINYQCCANSWRSYWGYKKVVSDDLDILLLV